MFIRIWGTFASLAHMARLFINEQSLYSFLQQAKFKQALLSRISDAKLIAVVRIMTIYLS